MINTVAVNYAACIKQEAHWGYDKFHNICTGTWSTVNWGSLDWTGHVVLGLVMAGVAAIVLTGVAGFIYTVTEDLRYYRS